MPAAATSNFTDDQLRLIWGSRAVRNLTRSQRNAMEMLTVCFDTEKRRLKTFLTSVQLRERWGGVSNMFLERKLKKDPRFPKPINLFGRLRLWDLELIENYERLCAGDPPFRITRHHPPPRRTRRAPATEDAA
jgi:hypothetical protein